MKEMKPVVTTEMATLFVEKQEENYEKIEGTDTYRLVPARKAYHLYIRKFTEGKENDELYHHLTTDIGNDDELIIHINSVGGLVWEGYRFYHIIKHHFRNRTTGIIESVAFSMGALLFCMCDRRLATKHAELMLHNYSHGAVGKGDEVYERVKFTKTHLNNFMKELLLTPKFMTKKEVEELILGKDFWMDAEEMLKRGIATEIIGDEKTKRGRS